MDDSPSPDSGTAPAPPLSPSNAIPPRPPPNFVTQHAISNHLMEITSLMHPPTFTEGRSVLAIVNFPADVKAYPACDGNNWQTVNLRMSHEKLIGLGSAKINRIFESRHQERLRRRHGMSVLPPGVEYILDLTPPAEGADLADLTAALWLPRMVKLWFLAGHYVPDPILETGPDKIFFNPRRMAEKAVGACLALGHDDVCRSDSCLTDTSQWEIRREVPGIIEDDHAKAFIPDFRKVDDYCPIRHRASILRVLRAINGDGLLLNSAARMWTVAQVAIHLEVPQAVVDPVTQWLIAPPNTKFIEICPERAFQLALGLNIPSVLITAFKILVSELAVDLAAQTPSPARPPLTWVKRKRDDYGDFPSDPVDYAARGMVERMTAHHKMLQSDNVFDLLPREINEWRKLQELGEQIIVAKTMATLVLKTRLELLRGALVAAFHTKVDAALASNLPIDQLDRLMEAQRRHYLSDAERTPVSVLYRRLDDSQKILVPFFWRELSRSGDYYAWRATTYRAIPLVEHVANFNRSLEEELRGSNLKSYLLARFDLEAFYNQLTDAVEDLCFKILHRYRGEDDENSIQLVLSDHLLLTLDEKELNFLPIWADGLDDGSGGVFQDSIPPAEMGPSEPGPAYHTGYTVATETGTTTMGGGAGPSTIAPSDLGIGHLDIDTDNGTVARSLDAQQSITTTGPARNRVVALGSEVFQASSDRFSVANDVEFADAMYAEPAAHQAHGQALAQYVEGGDEESISGSRMESSATMSGDGTAATEDGNGGDLDIAIAPEDAMDLEMELSDDGEYDAGQESDSTLGGSDYDLL